MFSLRFLVFWILAHIALSSCCSVAVHSVNDASQWDVIMNTKTMTRHGVVSECKLRKETNVSYPTTDAYNVHPTQRLPSNYCAISSGHRHRWRKILITIEILIQRWAQKLIFFHNDGANQFKSPT